LESNRDNAFVDLGCVLPDGWFVASSVSVTICNHCKIDKSSEFFSVNRARKNGLQAACKDCQKEAVNRSYEKNKDKNKKRYLEKRDEIKIRQAAYRSNNIEKYKEINNARRRKPKGRARTLFIAAKIRAANKGIEFNLTVEFIEAFILIGKCVRTGISFVLDPHDKYSNHPHAPSIDRKDPFKGYTFDNIQIVCNAYNTGKNQMTDEEFINFCKAVVEYHKK